MEGGSSLGQYSAGADTRRTPRLLWAGHQLQPILKINFAVCLYTNCEVPSLGRLPASHAGVMPDTGQVSTTTTSYLIIIINQLSDDNKLKSL